MSQYAIIENGIVVNLIEADAAFAATVGAVLADADCVIGSDYANGAFTLPVPPAPLGPTLTEAQATKTAALYAACRRAILVGFTSSALGAAHTYPTDDKSQLNLTASVTDSLLPNLPAGWTTPFMCADSSGVWAMRPHTAAQIQQAGSDGKAFVLKNLQQNATLAAQAVAATTVAAVQAIVWTNPA